MKYNEKDLRLAVAKSNNYNEVLFNLKVCPNNYIFLKKKLKEYNIDTSHFSPYKNRKPKKEIPLEDILKINGHYMGTGDIKKKLYKNNLKQPICELCGQDENWKGKKMSLILDHINGNRYDNRIENLRLVCPNCNTTLDTHCGKNKKTKEKIKSNLKIKIENQIELTKKSSIDFTKRGWRLELGKLINIHPQRADKFIKHNIPELYDILYKHKDKK